MLKTFAVFACGVFLTPVKRMSYSFQLVRPSVRLTRFTPLFLWTPLPPIRLVQLTPLIDDVGKKLIKKCAVWQKLVLPKSTPDFVNALVQDSIAIWPPSVCILGCDQEAPFCAYYMTCNSLVRCAIHAFFTNICVREITAFVILFFVVIRAFGRKCDRHLIFTVVIRYDICVALWDLRNFEIRL